TCACPRRVGEDHSHREPKPSVPFAGKTLLANIKRISAENNYSLLIHEQKAEGKEKDERCPAYDGKGRDPALFLPVELMRMVAKYLEIQDVVVCSGINRQWRDCIQSYALN